MNNLKKYYYLIVFDWEGTLFNSAAFGLNCFKNSIADLKLPMFDFSEYEALMGLSIQQIIDILYMDWPVEVRERLKMRYRFHSLLHQKEAILFPDTITVLQELHNKGYQLAIATGKNSVELKEDLIKTGLHDLFTVIRTADKTASKPNPMMLQEILSITQIKPERTLMVGDSPVDMQLAHNAHVDAAGIHADIAHQNGLKVAGAKFTISTLTELAEYLGSHTS